MVLDPELLDKARAAAGRLEQAQRDALLCRADYHTAVRRLHLAGGTLREVAEALSLSHQRVQQIVTAAGGTWWRSMWRGRRNAGDAVCTWCGRPPAEVQKLIAGPNVYICDSCVGKASDAAGGGSERSAPIGAFLGVTRRKRAGRCAFCSRGPGSERTLVTARQGNICSDCLQACGAILAR